MPQSPGYAKGHQSQSEPVEEKPQGIFRVLGQQFPGINKSGPTEEQNQGRAQNVHEQKGENR